MKFTTGTRTIDIKESTIIGISIVELLNNDGLLYRAIVKTTKGNFSKAQRNTPRLRLHSRRLLMRKGRFDNNEPCYVISIAARMLGVNAQTLRYYEKVGIIEPSRTKGNIRLYSGSDIERLRYIKTLRDDLGINLAGVEVILRMSDQILKMTL